MEADIKPTDERTRVLVCGRILAIAGVLAALLVGCRTHQQTRLTLSVAASLKDSIEEAETDYRRNHGDIDFSNNFGSSGIVAGQIAEGVPTDLFLSAAAKPMDDLQEKGLIADGTRRNLAGNTLVLIAPVDSKLNSFQGLTDKSIRLIALGDPASVPAGEYGKETLLSLHLWDQLNTRFVLGKDVRQVLTYVETGNADAGLVYATDAKRSGKVRMIATAPESTHMPIVYPAAIVKGSRNQAAARAFLDYLASPPARAIFQRHGFTMATT